MSRTASIMPKDIHTSSHATSELVSDKHTLNIAHLESLTNTSVYLQFLDLTPIHYARQHAVIVIEGENTPLLICDDLSQVSDAWDLLRRQLGCYLQLATAPRAVILQKISQAYEAKGAETTEFIENIEGDEFKDAVHELLTNEDLLDHDNRSPVIQLVNMLLFEAVKQKASDIHFHPYGDEVKARLRIDGVLFDAFTLPKHVQEEVTSRIKVMAHMNIAEKRLPQDGRTTVTMGEREIDLRVSSIPTSYGERVVIRLLDKGTRLFSLQQLGLDHERLQAFRDMIQVEHGLILVTGPTGSGKSTTLYAALQAINNKSKNILTLEDPIEYQLEGISQTQVNVRKGMTFASGLRSVLRQDPDIIMVGEIRDRETAVMAIQSALTGHLVFSTLHTNDAASAITRLLDLGVEPYLVASSLVGVLAQRLVRRLCPHCRQECPTSLEQWRHLVEDHEAVPGETIYQAQGCPSCRDTGYDGRLGVFEHLSISEPIRELIIQRAGASRIKREAMENGMLTLRDDGLQKVLSGQTTLDEIKRVTMRST